jgi:hypothetical protein
MVARTQVKNLRDIERKLITALEQIPSSFASREAEAEFWETHDFAEGVLEEGPEVDKEFAQALGLVEDSD